MYSIQNYVIKFDSDLSLATGQWFSLGTPVSPDNKTDHKDVIEILNYIFSNNVSILYIS
jgi:hypothetical protein